MPGLLLDTNIYGLFVERKDNEEIAKKIEEMKKEGKIVILNFRVIRDEIRNAKANKILEVYDSLTSNNMQHSNKQIERLANLYFIKYREKGGIQKKTQNFMNDLRIIAFATLKNINIICSEDRKAFHSQLAKDSYDEVNLRFVYRTPVFHTLNDLKKAFL
ncbi:hypothetical protein CMI38_02785 [Candidatus Pacearchaeota archaeon]|nr:hypothetical protein [Candidatus Pacearchaeota archaeon]|tara:strand:+ start:74 stop:553 length:480 start_codon:yes stop_codon:yes gene_type:complete